VKQQWEYKFEIRSGLLSYGEITRFLNQEGKKGWELVSLRANSCEAIFKRPISKKSNQ